MGLTKANFYKKPEIVFETSWDDGSEFDIRLAGILEKHGFVKNSTFFVVVDWVGKPGYLTWDDIKDLDRRGFKIGSHTVSHPMDLKEVHDDFLFVEIQSSKDLIEAALGHTIDSFCYPRGRGDSRVRAAVAEAGYLKARTTGDVGNTDASDKLWLPGTLHVHTDRYDGRRWNDYGRELVAKLQSGNGGYINLWGHSAEVDKLNQWAELESFLEFMKGALA